MLQFASQAEQFRAKAAVCLARSQHLPDPEYQRIFYDLAVEWLVLAAEADRKEGHQTDLVVGADQPLGRAGRESTMEPGAPLHIGGMSGQFPSPQAPVLWPDNTRARLPRASCARFLSRLRRVIRAVVRCSNKHLEIMLSQ
jgi:hypothetical protein